MRDSLYFFRPGYVILKNGDFLIASGATIRPCDLSVALYNEIFPLNEISLTNAPFPKIRSYHYAIAAKVAR